MKLIVRYWFGLFSFILISMVVWHTSLAATQLPALTFKTINGDVITNDDLKGAPALIAFWATDCSTCIQEIPDLIDLYEDYQRQGLKILAVAMYYDPPNRVVSMSKGMQLPYSVVIDPKAEISRALNVQVTPTHVLVAADGRIIERKVGLMNVRDIRNKIEAQLVKPKGS